MQIVLENFGVFLASLPQTNSQAQKGSELKGYYQRWTDASIPVHMAIYLYAFSMLCHLSLGFQQELHDPVKAVCCIQEFTQTMAKLKLLIYKSLDSPETLPTSTNFCQILKNATATIFTQVLNWPNLKKLEREFVIITHKQYNVSNGGKI